MITDCRGTARCVIRTSSVEIKTFDVVSEECGAGGSSDPFLGAPAP
ncbi:MAG TPA: hypothetical protein VFH93_13255 [Thermoleophilia bacterium]|nr:hypothetical protein [Thermoleophilia bacterium]